MDTLDITTNAAAYVERKKAEARKSAARNMRLSDETLDVIRRALIHYDRIDLAETIERHVAEGVDIDLAEGLS